MSKQHTQSTGLWARTAQALGKLFAGVVSLHDDRRQATNHAHWTNYPRFPAF